MRSLVPAPGAPGAWIMNIAGFSSLEVDLPEGNVQIDFARFRVTTSECRDRAQVDLNGNPEIIFDSSAPESAQPADFEVSLLTDIIDGKAGGRTRMRAKLPSTRPMVAPCTLGRAFEGALHAAGYRVLWGKASKFSKPMGLVNLSMRPLDPESSGWIIDRRTIRTANGRLHEDIEGRATGRFELLHQDFEEDAVGIVTQALEL